jgi:hypothetical protein
MVDILRLLFIACVVRAASTCPLLASFFLPGFKIVITPYAIDPFEVDIPSVFSKFYRYTAIAESRTLFNLLFNGGKYRNILERNCEFIPLRTP